MTRKNWTTTILMMLVLFGVLVEDCFSFQPLRLRPSNYRTAISSVAEYTDTSPAVHLGHDGKQPAVLRAPESTNCADTIALWERLVPKPWDPRALDRKVHWDASDSVETASAQLLAGVKLPDKARMEDDLARSMRAFQSICQDNDLQPSSFSARLVASRGKVGTKCPQWHLDHVPVRWIQALVGPGVLYVQNKEAIRWDAINNLDDDDEDDRNARLVDESIADIRQAATGEAVLVLGNAWPDKNVSPAVHRSPEGLLPWQGRVLLTIDVHRDED